MSVSFDRAAEYYDGTRSFPDDTMARLVPMLVAELPREQACLEIGIGTGRIALPLVDEGIQVVGVDISTEMLRKLLAKRTRDWPEVAIADASHLPFSDGTFGSAVASHVLHLIPEWKAALLELSRVLVPGGVLLASRGAQSEAEWAHRIRRRFFAEAGDPPWPPGMDTIDQLDEEMKELGASVRRLSDVTTERSSSVREFLTALEAGIWSACWSIDETTRRRATAATREWATREFADLDEQRPTLSRSVWGAYRLAE